MTFRKPCDNQLGFKVTFPLDDENLFTKWIIIFNFKKFQGPWKGNLVLKHERFPNISERFKFKRFFTCISTSHAESHAQMLTRFYKTNLFSRADKYSRPFSREGNVNLNFKWILLKEQICWSSFPIFFFLRQWTSFHQIGFPSVEIWKSYELCRAIKHDVAAWEIAIWI